jgi:hypothetical protein
VAHDCGHVPEKGGELGRGVTGEESRRGGIELVGWRGEPLPHAVDPGTHLLLGQRAFPAGVRIDEDQRRDEPGMVAVELEHDGATPGEACDVRRPGRNRLDQHREAVRVVREREIRGHIRGAARAWLVPRDHRELVGQRGALRLPHATVHGGAVYEHQRRPLADALVGDHEPLRPYDLHRAHATPRRQALDASGLAF